MRRALQLLYAASGMLAAFFMVLMAALVVVQIGARLAGAQVPSADDFARLSMAASAFLGLAFALRSGAHIRVTLFVERTPPRLRAALEVVCLATAGAVCAWFAWATGQTTVESWQFGELTIGAVPIPKWLPLGGMTLGIALVAVAFLDDLIAVLRGRVPAYRAPSQFQQTEG
jgi:TRAP-type C4-dicarboxylate transport system permease small subunit